MDATLTRDYKCAPEGHTTLSYKAGSVVSGRVAEMAIRDGAAVVNQPRPKVTKPKAPKEVK